MAFEPRVEDLLATIRLAIDSDINELDRNLPNGTASQSAGLLTRGSIREMRVSYDQPTANVSESIASLRDRVGRQKIENKVSVQNTIAPPKPAVRANLKPDGIGSILSGESLRPPRVQPPMLRASYIDDEPLPEPAYEPAPLENTWVEQAPDAYYEPQAYQPQALMSPQASYNAQSSFQALTDTIMARALGDSDIEGMTRDMLRPMLKSWLDDNLPPLVEKLVREEIERVARRGR